MSPARPRRSITLAALMWLGLLGAPFAWTIQHVAGYGLTEANCQEASKAGWHIHLDVWTIVFTGSAVIVGLAGLAAALATWRRTKDAGTEPPGARIHFLSIIALTTTPLFLAIMLMSGIGVLFLTGCRQS
jgi:heme/copper-type cytochrome/quinol oxidase subunit 2